MRRPRGLSREEAALWAQVAKTVRPFPPRNGEGDHAQHGGGVQASDPDGAGQIVPSHAEKRAKRGQDHPRVPLHHAAHGSPPPKGEERRPLDRHGLDASWERRLARGTLSPDFTLDLHGHSLDAAHARLDHGLSQATALGARVVLVITGKPRGAEAADRGGTRGAIRAKLLDWLAHGAHAHKIAAVRGAHPRHGGAGALYLIMKRPR